MLTPTDPARWAVPEYVAGTEVISCVGSHVGVALGEAPIRFH
jgi:hypothetical protein